MCNLIHTDLKPENVLVSLRLDELEEIKRKGCLKDPKHKPSHVMDGTTNFADIALGDAFRKCKNQKQHDKSSQEKSANENKDGSESEPEPAELQYADILPEYAEMNKNQKKRTRQKYKIQL